MSKRILNEQNIRDIMVGATVLGGGGGGSLKDGVNMLESYKKYHPNETPQVTLIDYEEMDPKSHAVVVAGMGAPSAINKVDFSMYAVNSFNAIKDMAAKLSKPKDIQYALAVEMGGFNTFVPMLISMVGKLPFIDADGAGRAVPALNTLLLHINGCDTSPLAMANGNNDRVNIELNNPMDAELAEEVGRHICMAFGMLSGLAGWMLDKNEVRDRIAVGTVSMAEKIGKTIRECLELKKLGNVFAELNASGACKVREICKGAVVKMETIQESGFDHGVVIMEDGSQKNVQWKIDFQNENLMLTKVGNGESTPWMTVPDIICMIDLDTGTPLTNADIKEGMKAGLGVISVDHKWWMNPDMFLMWKPFLEKVGYTGGNIPFNSIK